MQPSIRILLVEDDPLVILTVEDALKDGGFVVFTAADGASAVRLLEASDADYRAVVTDVNLSPRWAHWVGCGQTCARAEFRCPRRLHDWRSG